MSEQCVSCSVYSYFVTAALQERADLKNAHGHAFWRQKVNGHF